MRYKASLIACAVIVVALALSFFFTPEVVTSQVENRNMTTFKMILDPVDDIDPNTGERSILYNADKSIPDRLEDAMKDQIFVRNFVVLNYTNLEAKLSNIYLGASKTLSSVFKERDNVSEDGPSDSDSFVDIPEGGYPDEYYDLTEKDEEDQPLDFKKYPVYGYARLEVFPSQSYDYTNIGSRAAYNGTDYLGFKPSKNLYYNFLYKIREAGVTVPVIPGIMPITGANQVERALKLSGSFMPRRFAALVDQFGHNPAAMKQAGIAYATDQIIDLYANGIQNVHVYSMNKPDVARAILENVSAILG